MAFDEPKLRQRVYIYIYIYIYIFIYIAYVTKILKKYKSEENNFYLKHAEKFNFTQSKKIGYFILLCFSKQLFYDLKAYNYRLFKDAVNEFERM